MNAKWRSAYQEIPRSYAWMAIAAACAASTFIGLANDFIYDDIPLVRDNPRVHALAGIREIFTNPYWPPPYVEQLYRPLTLAVLTVEYTLGQGAPLMIRLMSYVLYAACGIALFHLTEAVLPRRIALAAAMLFVVHPVHVEAVALGVNQAELLVALAAIASVTTYIRARRTGALSARTWAVLAALYATATLCKEGGFFIPALLIAAELTVIDDQSVGSRFGKLAVGYLTLAVVAALAYLIRLAVLPDGPFHVVPVLALRGAGLDVRVLTMLAVVPTWLRLFVWPAHLQADYPEITASSHFGAPEAFGLSIVIVALAVIIRSFRRAPVIAFGLLWCAISLLPVSNLVPTGVLLAERTLFLPSVGFLIAVAGAASHWLAHDRRPAATRITLALWAIALVLGTGRSVGRLHVWNSRYLRVVPAPQQSSTPPTR